MQRIGVIILAAVIFVFGVWLIIISTETETRTLFSAGWFLIKFVTGLFICAASIGAIFIAAKRSREVLF